MWQRTLIFLQITVGTTIAALAVNLFMISNHLATGGMSGLLMIMQYRWQIPMGPVYFVVNLPALFFLWRIFGWNMLLRQLWGTAWFSLMLIVSAPLVAFAPTHNLMLASIYGGALVGIGIGITIRVGGSTGGTAAIAQVFRHYTGFDVSKFLLISDVVVLLLAGVMLSPEAILYGLIATFLFTRALQVIQEGFSTSRCLLIISERSDEVLAAVLTEINRGATLLQATGAYSQQSKPVLMCVVSEMEMPKVRKRVLEVDAAAFIVVMNANEVTGRGFTLDTELRRIPFWVTQRQI